MKLYKIIRKFRDENCPDEIIKTGLNLDEAMDHCSDPDTHGEGWFDCFYEEDK